MLTLKEFLKLSPKEKAKRYSELSEKERFLARMSDWSPNDTITVKGSSKEDKQKQEEFIKQLEDALEQDGINTLK